MKTTKSSFLLFASSVSLAQAAVLARWTPVSVASDAVVGAFYDNASDTPPADEVAAGLIVSTLDRIGAAEVAGNAGAVWSGSSTNGATGISLPDYTTFTITPTSGFAVNYASVSYSYQTYAFQDPEGYLLYLRSSVDGFSDNLATGSIDPGTGGAGTAFFDASSLSGIIDPVEFRIYASAPNAPAGSRWFDLQGGDSVTDVGLIADGTVVATPIPELSTGLLSGLACLALTFRRRRG
ncbi:MAG: hypothetical protein ACJAQT_005198 [Akkermansiaceae bacterium]|jgi:hypothetical protein